MSDGTAIEWADATWNPIIGCSKVSPGCDYCYAIVNANIRQANPNEKVAAAYSGVVLRDASGALDWTGHINLLDGRLDQPIRWRRARRIFVNAQSDLFHEQVPDAFIAKVFAVMAVCPRHTFQILTKRHGRMRSLLRSAAFENLVDLAIRDLMMTGVITEHVAATAPRLPLPNVWLGVSVEDQKWASIRIPALLGTPAAVRWLSCEPLLGPVDLRTGQYAMPPAGEFAGTTLDGIDWVVTGGESGPGARPMHPDWPRWLRDQCLAAGVPYLFKQWGDWTPDRSGQGKVTANRFRYEVKCIGPDGTIQPETGPHLADPTWATMFRKGKKAAGRELDGRTWDEYPGESQ